MDERLQSLNLATATAIDLAVKFGPKLVAAVLILIAGYFIARWSGRATGRALAKFDLEPPVRALLERTAQALTLGLFIILALQNLGMELLPLIAGLGILGAGVALATQGVLGNMVAGLTLIFSPPFRVGEHISIAKEEGEVLEIGLFDTTLGHADLSRVVIPNRRIVGEILHNYGRIRQLGIEVGVAYDTDLAAATAAMQEVLRVNPRVLKDPQPVVKVVRLAESGIVMGAAPWVNAADAGAAASEINQAIVEIFRHRHIVIPVPQREIRQLTSSAYLAGQRREVA